MSAIAWRERYTNALATALRRAASLAADPIPELIACGFTTNVDRVVDLTGDLLAGLIGDTSVSLDGPRRTRAACPSDLVTAIVQCVAAGEGIDLSVSDPATQEWLLDRVDGRLQLGGTGAQAANTLARLGFTTLLHHTGLSPIQARGFDASGRILVATPAGLQPVDAAVNRCDPTMWHVALEYRAGLSVDVDGRSVTAPHPNRVIVSYDPVNAAFMLDPCFVEAVATVPNPIARVLLSGFSQVVVPDALDYLLDETVDAIRRWRSVRPGLLVHVELGAMPQAMTLAGVVERLAPEVDSVGLNVDELRDLLRVWDHDVSGDPVSVVSGLAMVRSRTDVPRVGVHSLATCLSVTTRDPEVERIALLFAALVASTRARVGTFPTPADLAATFDAVAIHPEGIAAIESLGLHGGIGRWQGDWLVVVPTIAVPRPDATVGLGDSFTAGLLAAW